MKNTISKVIATSLLSCLAFSFAHAADENASKAEVNKQIQVCKNKKQGDWVVYANKGVTYNGSCEPNANGKLQFTFPAPAGGNSAAAIEPAAASTPALEQVPAATADAPAAVNEAPQATEQSSEQPTEAAPAIQ